MHASMQSALTRSLAYASDNGPKGFRLVAANADGQMTIRADLSGDDISIRVEAGSNGKHELTAAVDGNSVVIVCHRSIVPVFADAIQRAVGALLAMQSDSEVKK